MPKSEWRDDAWKRLQFWRRQSKLGLSDFDHAAFRTNIYLACKEFGLDATDPKDRHTLLCILSAILFPAPAKNKAALAPIKLKLPSHTDLKVLQHAAEIRDKTGCDPIKAITEAIKLEWGPDAVATNKRRLMRWITGAVTKIAPP